MNFPIGNHENRPKTPEARHMSREAGQVYLNDVRAVSGRAAFYLQQVVQKTRPELFTPVESTVDTPANVDALHNLRNILQDAYQSSYAGKEVPEDA